MLLEDRAPIRRLLLMVQPGVVEMVAIGVIVVAAPVVLLLVRVGGVAASPVTEFYIAHRHKNGTAIGTGEESMSFVGPVACSPTCR